MNRRILWSARALVRIARSTLAASVFAALALPLALQLLVLRRLARRGGPEAAERAELEAQRRLHLAAQRYLRFAVRGGYVRVTGIDTERLQRAGPHLVAANHPSLIDIVVLCSLMPQADMIVNPARARNPVLRGLVRAAGCVRSDLGPDLVRECADRLRRGRSLIVFPEGTRSPRGGLGPFQRGAAHIALRAGCPLLPVVIRCDPPAMWKHWRWYDLPDQPIHVTVRTRDPIPVRPIAQSGVSSPVAARRLSAELREAIAKGLEEGTGEWPRPKHSSTS